MMTSTTTALSSVLRLNFHQTQRALSSLAKCPVGGACWHAASIRELSSKEKRSQGSHLKMLFYQPVRFAGHSKWQNIRHTKAAKDKQRSDIIARMNSKLKIAIREGGGIDPAFNFQLARVIAQAQAADVPKTNIDNAIKQVTKEKDKGSKYMVEARGPGFSSLMVETYTDKQMRTRQTIQSMLKYFNCRVESPGNAMRSFDEKGVLQVEVTESEVDMDKYTEVAIEVGAEDVEEFIDEDGTKFLKFICDKKELHIVKKNLEAENFVVPYAKLEYIPHTMAALVPEELEIFEKLLDKLMTHENVVRIYDNIEAAS